MFNLLFVKSYTPLHHNKNKNLNFSCIQLRVAIMEDVPSNTTANTSPSTSTNVDMHVNLNDFQNTSRVGRRNALPDILNDDGTITTDLPEKLGALTTNDPSESTPNASTSKPVATANNAVSSTSNKSSNL